MTTTPGKRWRTSLTARTCSKSFTSSGCKSGKKQLPASRSYTFKVNTVWQPIFMLTLLISVSRKRYLEVPPDPRTSWERTSEFADRLCPPPAQWVAEQYMKEKHTKVPLLYELTFCPDFKLKMFQWPESKLKKRLEWLCKRKAPKETDLEELKQQLMHRHVDSLRKDQQSRLKEWEREVNQLDTVKIKVENDFDLEGPPRYLKYIHKYYPSEVRLDLAVLIFK